MQQHTMVQETLTRVEEAKRRKELIPRSSLERKLRPRESVGYDGRLFFRSVLLTLKASLFTPQLF